MSSRSDKIALFIDGANLYATCRTVGFDVDFKRLLHEFASRGNLVRALYYTAIVEDQESSAIRPLLDWLDYNGYSVVRKAAKEFIDSNGQRKIKGNMAIEIVVDALELAAHVDGLQRPLRGPVGDLLETGVIAGIQLPAAPGPLGAAVERQVDEHPTGIGVGVIHRADPRPAPRDDDQAVLDEVLGVGQVPRDEIRGPQQGGRGLGDELVKLGPSALGATEAG